MGAGALALLYATSPSTLTYARGEFVLRQGRQAWRAPLKPRPTEPRRSLAFRRDDDWVVWDERGVTVRVGSRVRSYRLGGTSGVAGGLRIGSRVYLALRWSAWGGVYKEAVYVARLGRLEPPRRMARVPGLTLETGVVNDWLRPAPNGIALPVQTRQGWGMVRLDERVERWEMGLMENRLERLEADGRYVDRTPDGRRQAGWVDLTTGERTLGVEVRGPLRWLGEGQTATDGANLRWLRTGEVAAVPPRSGSMRIGPYPLTYRLGPDGSPVAAEAWGQNGPFVVARWTQVAP